MTATLKENIGKNLFLEESKVSGSILLCKMAWFT